jgi:hypothetical protein
MLEDFLKKENLSLENQQLKDNWVKNTEKCPLVRIDVWILTRWGKNLAEAKHGKGCLRWHRACVKRQQRTLQQNKTSPNYSRCKGNTSTFAKLVIFFYIPCH